MGKCIREGILAEFLKKNKTEVIAVSIFEYNKEEEEKKLRKAEYEAGYDDGKKNGLKVGIAEGEAHTLMFLAQAMLREREPADRIAKYTGYSIDELKEIAAKMENP